MKNTDHILWKRWTAFRNSINNPNNYAYKYYGARGIDYDPAWDDFWKFVKDIESKIGPLPGPEYFLDRKNNDLGYWKNNMCWSTAKENSNNRQDNCKITYKGKTQTLSQWATELDMNNKTIWSRIYDHGMTPREALRTPIKKTGRHMSNK